MTDTFFCSDIHFGHKNIIQFENEIRNFETIEEHDAEIIKRWNNKVSNKDTVWILGDMVINKKHLEKYHELNGRKLLVMGNHDNFNQTYFREHLLKVVERTFGCVEKRFGGITSVLTHIPVHPCQLEHRFNFNLHGHLHSSLVLNNDGTPDIRYVNLSMEHWNLTPVNFGELKTEIDKRWEYLKND